ncbi:Non-repetitive/WGA-negative nucleoporin C-terminal-domain-containing protein [Geopyxis carbonaria]|nr:Non-repetitive/WGA-negative nucleoporin C-terminal-domain-containing protein [Geopyxis carbonaria]
MFSPQPPPAGEGHFNPNRRRPRQNIVHPASRTAQRHERSESNVSHVREGSTASAGGSVASGEMAITRRASTITGKDMDGGVVDWTRNETYRVSKLPALPPIFKTCTVKNTKITATTNSANGYALLLSHNSAYVWNYTTPHTLPNTYSFPLPIEDVPKHVDGPFPLGALVSPSANSSEPGLVVVMPMTGQVAYWDSVGSAVAEGLFSRKRGVEGKVPLMSSESAISICAAEPAGFMIALSSGRLAHLSLRDSHGRPGITVTIMREHGTGIMGGLLGALRAGSARRDVMAVRAGRIIRMGEREVVVATTRGTIARWHISRSGAYANVSDLDLREQILAALEQSERGLNTRREQYMVMDIAVMDHHVSSSAEDHDVRILVFGAYRSGFGEDTLYSLVYFNLLAGGHTAAVENVHIIRSYTDPLEIGQPPRLYLPNPGKTAFLVFPRAVVVVSTLQGGMLLDDAMEDNDEEQPGVFEDVIDFRGDVDINIIGGGMEDVEISSTSQQEVSSSFGPIEANPQVRKHKNPGIIVVAKGAGVIRIEAFDVDGRRRVAAAPVTVKSKLEQAVFYGIKQDNPLNFRGRKETKYPIEDVEAAALQISKEILGSRSPYLPTLLPALDAHLALRENHLRALVAHLRTGDVGRVSQEVFWELLSDAEKCTAARAVWDTRNTRMRENPDAGEGVLENTIINHLTSEGADIADNDPVRTWFQREVEHIGELVHCIKKGINAPQSKGKLDPITFADADAEANAVIIAAMMAAWDFRVNSAELYNLAGQSGIDQNGLCKNSLNFPAPWTSSPAILGSLDEFYDFSTNVLTTIGNPKSTEDPRRLEIVEKISEQLVHLAEILCRAFVERADWCDQKGAAGEQNLLQEGTTVRERYIKSRGNWIKPLVTNHLDKAYEIAEKWQDYRTLVEICSVQVMDTEVKLAQATAGKDSEATEDLKETMAETSQRLERYFEGFGEHFAVQMYEYLVENGQLQKLINGFEQWRQIYLTPFLRDDAKYAKLSWIHEVSLNNYQFAGEVLLKVATDSEEDLRRQQIELSIGKLAKLAGVQRDGGSADSLAAQAIVYDVKIDFIKIQQKLYEAVVHIKRDALDIDAAVHLATDEYGHKLRRKPGLREIFRKAFKELIQNKALKTEELVDLLTLMETEGGILGGDEFYWALRAVALAGLPQARRDTVERTIWRRCFLRDDWTSLTATRNKTDDQVQELTRETCLYRTLRLCFAHGLFTDESPFQPMAPADCAFSADLKELLARFPTADEHTLNDIGHALIGENTKLEAQLKRGNLANWFQGILMDAREEKLAGVDVHVSIEGDTVMEE